MIVTIARECGSGGHALGEQLAAHYGIPLLDKAVLMERADKAGVLEEMDDFVHEKPVNSLLYSIAMFNGENTVGQRTLKTLRELITEPSFVLVGRCGNFLYGEEPDCVSLFIHRNAEQRAQRFAQQEQISLPEARRRIRKVDENRAAFHKLYTGQVWGDVRSYQLALDAGRLNEQESLAVLERYIDARCAGNAV